MRTVGVRSYDGRCAQLWWSVCTVGVSADGHGPAAPAACRGLKRSSAGRLRDLTRGDDQCRCTCGLRVRCSDAYFRKLESQECCDVRSCTATSRGKMTGMPGCAGPYHRVRASTEQAQNHKGLDQ